METKTQVQYKSFDGKLWDNEKICKQYEEDMSYIHNNTEDVTKDVMDMINSHIIIKKNNKVILNDSFITKQQIQDTINEEYLKIVKYKTHEYRFVMSPSKNNPNTFKTLWTAVLREITNNLYSNIINSKRINLYTLTAIEDNKCNFPGYFGIENKTEYLLFATTEGTKSGIEWLKIQDFNKINKAYNKIYA